jgi:predicted membrane channel-forming protein YqfA (hemolysin III family)
MSRDPSAREQFWEFVCGFDRALFFLLLLDLTFLLLLGYAALGLEPGTESYVVLQFDLVIVGGSLLAIGAVFYWCRKRAY